MEIKTNKTQKTYFAGAAGTAWLSKLNGIKETQHARFNGRLRPSHEKTFAEYTGVDLSSVWPKASA